MLDCTETVMNRLMGHGRELKCVPSNTETLKAMHLQGRLRVGHC